MLSESEKKQKQARNTRNIPRLRFAGFNDEWEKRKFSKLYDKVNEKNDLSFGKDKIISVANMYFREENNTNSTLDYMKSYNIFRKGDIAFEGNKSKKYSYGRFVENDIGDGIVSHVFDVFRPKTEYDLAFWKYLINNENVMAPVLRKVTTKATMMTNLVSNDFLRAQISVPSICEQVKIGNFLSALDALIVLRQRKLELLKEQKKGYLQKMFPKKGENVPELRFPGYTDAWEQRQLGEELDLLKDGTHGTHKNVDQGPYLLSAKNIKNGQIVIDKLTDRKISNDAFNLIHKNFSLQKGDVLLTIVGSIGESAVIDNPVGITFQRSVAYLRPSKKLLSRFLLTNINSAKFQEELKKRQVVSAQPGIYLGDLSVIPVLFPSIEEQRKLGEFFQSLDHLITLHQRKLAVLKERKKAYLQKIFV